MLAQDRLARQMIKALHRVLAGNRPRVPETECRCGAPSST